jgi:hypothetical protein
MERVAFRRGDPPGHPATQAPTERRDVLLPADRVFRDALRTDMDVFTIAAWAVGLNRGVWLASLNLLSSEALTEYETAKKSNARDPAMSLQVDLDRRGIAKLI